MTVVHHQRMDQLTIRSRRAAVAGFSAMIALIGVALPSVEALGQTRFALVPPPAGSFSSAVTGLSDDGMTYCGHAIASVNSIPRYIGLLQRPLQPLEVFGSTAGNVNTTLPGVSGDGRFVVGCNVVDTLTPAVGFRAANATNILVLPVLATFRGNLSTAVNHDGSVVVGYANVAGSLSRQQAFRWTPQGGIQGLGYLRANSPFQSQARAVSADGNTIAGVSIPEYNTGLSETFVWRPQTGMQLLPAPQGSATEAGLAVTGMSKDGNYIVGNWSADRRLRRGVLWSNGTPMDLGDLAPNSTVLPEAVSADGRVVAGTTGFNGQQAPFIWSPDSGLRLLTSVLSENGVVPTPGVQLLACDAMTPDGKTFAGTCTYNGQTMGYVVSIPAPGIGAWLMVAGVVVQRRRR